jgi:hypothetical protein
LFSFLTATALTLARPHSSQNGPEDAPEAIIEGLVRDIACSIPNKEASATQLSVKCPLACARSGSPLVILAPLENYPTWISGKSSCHSWRSTCGSVAGVYERMGTRMITIKNIEESKDVHLTIADQ